uniref:Uncharacterized protein n=2 Tax=viral metagenome TaxID=1070528 RepID=A0A6M3J0V4_9ZZZZ
MTMKIEQIHSDLAKCKEILRKVVDNFNKDSSLRSVVLDAKNAVSDAFDDADQELIRAKATNGKPDAK